LDAVLEVDKPHGGHIKKLLDTMPREEGLKPKIPGCLAAAALHDSVHQTRFVKLIMNHLENLALLIMMADARMKDTEIGVYEAYFLDLRRS